MYWPYLVLQSIASYYHSAKTSINAIRKTSSSYTDAKSLPFGQSCKTKYFMYAICFDKISQKHKVINNMKWPTPVELCGNLQMLQTWFQVRRTLSVQNARYQCNVDLLKADEPWMLFTSCLPTIDGLLSVSHQQRFMRCLVLGLVGSRTADKLYII
jgi:hypothetical protein